MAKLVMMNKRTILAAGAALLFGGTALAAQSVAALSDSTRALHLLRRATFGARPGDLETVLELGRDRWLDRQLNPARIDDPALAERRSAFPLSNASPAALFRDFSPPPPRPADSVMTAEQRRRRRQQNPQRILADLVGAKLTRAVWSERQLEEVMTDFWFNHFNVVFNKGLDRFLVSDYERNAIRPRVFGKFEDMLRATAQHPAMLFYLDNWTSSVPDSLNGAMFERRRQAEERLRRYLSLTAAQRDALIRSGRLSLQEKSRLEAVAGLSPEEQRRVLDQALQRNGTRGINENYARELLELHTLGVDGGYTQQDVIEVARALTGWTFPRFAQRGRRGAVAPGAKQAANVGFTFNALMHDSGEKNVLGHRLPAGRGVEDGLDVLHITAVHPATATHIATKLIERFVTDQPDPEFVMELAGVFTRTQGDLREVTRALFSSPRFYEPRHVGAKIKTPFELVASALRVTRAETGPSRPLMEVLRSLGQLPYTESAPTGFPAASQEWVNSGAMLARMNFGLNLASGRIPGIRPAAPGTQGRQAQAPAVAEMLAVLLPWMDTSEVALAIARDLETQPAGSSPRTLAARAAGLALGSPEFQRR